jgi:hypothetical protein
MTKDYGSFTFLPVDQSFEKIPPKKTPNVFENPQEIMGIFNDFFTHLNRDLTTVFKKPQRIEIYTEKFALVFLKSVDLPEAFIASKNIEVELLGVSHRFEDVSNVVSIDFDGVTMLSFKFATYKARIAI